MKVLFNTKYTYCGRVGERYAFNDQYGDTYLLTKAKLVDRESNSVTYFNACSHGEDIVVRNSINSNENRTHAASM